MAVRIQTQWSSMSFLVVIGKVSTSVQQGPDLWICMHLVIATVLEDKYTRNPGHGEFK